jgi:hypothetical protein
MKQRSVGEKAQGFSRVVSLALRFRSAVVILFLLGTLLLGLEAAHIRMEDNLVDSMIPGGHPFLKASRAIDAMSTQAESLIAILEVRQGDVYNPETMKKVERITRELMGVEKIMPRKILSLATGLNHYDNTAEGLVGEPILGRVSPETEEDFLAVKRRVAVNPLGIGHFVSFDGTATLISAGITNLKTKAELSYNQMTGEERKGLSLERYTNREIERFHQELLDLVSRLKLKEEDPNHILHLTGDRLLAAELTSMARRQIPVAAAVMVALMLALLVGHLRSFRWALVPVFAFALSVLWGLGAFGASRLVLSPAAFLFPLLLGIVSLVCGAIAVEAYQRRSAPGRTKAQAVALAYRDTGVAASVAAAGLAALSSVVADVPMIRESGWLGLFWAVSTFGVVVLVCPVLMSLLGRPAGAAEERPADLCRALAGKVIRAAQARRRGAAVALALILALGVLCAWNLKVGGNVPGPDYVRSSHPWNRGFRVFAERFIGPYTLLVHARAKGEGGLLDPEAINQMGDVSTHLKAEGIARESFAFDWIVKMGRIALLDGNPKWWTVPASKEDMAGLSKLLTFSGELDVLVDQPFNQATVASFFEKSDADRIDGYVCAIQRYIDEHPSEHVDFSLGGGLLAKVKMVNDGTRGCYRKTLALALASVFVACLLFLRSVRFGFFVTLSVAAAQALVLALMTVLGWPVSLVAVPAGVAGAGFGAVLGILLVRQTAQAARLPGGANEATAAAGEGPGGEVLFLGLLGFAGALPWCFIGLKLQADMALVLGITCLAQAVSAVAFIPALTANSSRS